MQFRPGVSAQGVNRSGFARLGKMVWLPAIASLAGCTGGEFDTGRAALLAQTVASRAVWEDAAVSNYEYVYQRTCFCGAEFVRPLRIQVRSGVVSSVTFADTGAAVTDTALGPFPTIDGLFDDLQARIIEADNVNAEFDVQFGFPSEYIVDLQAAVADEEYSIAVTGFRQL